MASKNQRRNFLGKIGALGLGSLLPFSRHVQALVTEAGDTPLACTLIPSETRGPFPLFQTAAISSQTALVRSDIRESQTGVPLVLTVTVQNLDCMPIPGAKVYIWHCSKDGLYSGYSNGMNPGQAGLTYLRGIQTTDAAGQVTFTTVYPGWYNGRLTHIHAEVYVGNVLLRTSQFAFPLDSVTGSSTALVNAYYGKANNSITGYSGDNVFSDGYTSQLLTDLAGSTAAGYNANHNFIVNYSVLPLHLVSFTAGIDNKNPMLWWITENELNMTYFDIEQSTHPSRDYTKIGTVTARNTSTTNNYSFALQQPLPADIVYYRLKMYNTDGTFNYSVVVTLHAEAFQKISIVNNYATNEIIVKHPTVHSNSTLKVVSLNGQLVATGQLKTGASNTSINVKQLSDGIYLLIIESGIDRFVTKFYKGH